MRHFESIGREEMDQVAGYLISSEDNRHIWTFEGDLGAGKTTLIQSICRHLGVEGAVSSPTFSLVNTYTSAEGRTIHHFDCYRIQSADEAIRAGLQELLDSGDLCLIEWPEKILPLLEGNALRKVVISGAGEVRSVRVE